MSISTITQIAFLLAATIGLNFSLAEAQVRRTRATQVSVAAQTQVLTLSNPNLTARPGQSLSFSTRFNAVPMLKNYVVFVHFVNSAGKASSFGADYNPTPATTQWSGLITANRTVTVPASLPAGVYSVRIGLYENVAPYLNRAVLAVGSGVTADSENRYIVGQLTVSSSTTSPAPAPAPTPAPAPAPAPAPQQTQALTLATANLTAQPGQVLSFTTRFNAVPMTKSYMVFVHFVNSTGGASSFGADYAPTPATTQWSGLITANRTVTVPANLPAGQYTIRVGLYENVAPYTNRAPLAVGSGVIADNENRYTVGTLTVGAPASAPAPSPTPTSTPVTSGGSTPKPGSLTGLTASGPITLESNRTYSGLRISNPNGRCVYGYNVTNVRITNSEIGPCGNGSQDDAHGIVVHTSTNVRIDHNIVHDTASGIAAVNSQGVVVDHNHISKIRGPMPAGHIILFDSMHGEGNKMLCNVGENTEADGTEDNVNTWQSKGTPSSYLEIAYNRITGGHSKTGTGINIGDGGSDYVDVHDNTIVNVNNAGIGVSSGNFLKIRNNKVYNNGTYSSVGISVRNWYAGCSNIEVTGNRVWAFDHIWGMNSVWHYLNTGECSNVTESGNTFGDTSLSPAIFSQEYPQCQ